jgi:hypothetical protein
MFLAPDLFVADVVGLGFCMGWFHLSSGSYGKETHVTVLWYRDSRPTTDFWK